MSAIDERNTRLLEYTEKSEAIKTQIKTIAENKGISVTRGTDTPQSVLTKINSGTIATPTATKSITENGAQQDVTNYKYVDVAVAPNVSEKTITSNGTYLASDENVDGFSKVTVDVQGGGSGYVICVADIENTTITITNSGAQVVDTYTTPTGGGSHNVSVSSTGMYSVTAVRSGSTVWTTNVNVSGIGIFFAKVPLNIYTAEQIHNICQAGIFEMMFNIKDEWTFSQSGSILNNTVHLVEKIETVNGKNIVQFRKKFPYGTSYIWDNYFAYLSSDAATSFSGTYSSAGGYKYSTLRISTMMKQGDSVYMQATGIIPDSSSISTGIKFSEIYYTDGNGTKSGVYTYDPVSDTFTADSTFTSFASSSLAQTGCKFLKGYFVSVGTITQEVFNAGYYYTRSGSAGSGTGYIYTRETSWSSSTTYYGFYENIKDDSLFVNAYSSIKQYLVSFSDYSSTGLTNTTNLSLTTDLVNINSVEEFTGLNRYTPLKNTSYTGSQLRAYNIPGEGSLLPAYTSMYDIYCGQSEWTRSAGSNGTNSACCLGNLGVVNGNFVYIAYVCRPGFRIS